MCNSLSTGREIKKGKERDLPYKELIKLWNKYKELTKLSYMLLMEIEAALYEILTLDLPITQILNNDVNNILLFGTDINDCLLDVCGSNSICKNTKGSFHCKCKPGFHSTTGDGKDCSGETVEMRGCFFLKHCCQRKWKQRLYCF